MDIIYTYRTRLDQLMINLDHNALVVNRSAIFFPAAAFNRILDDLRVLHLQRQERMQYILDNCIIGSNRPLSALLWIQYIFHELRNDISRANEVLGMVRDHLKVENPLAYRSLRRRVSVWENELRQAYDFRTGQVDGLLFSFRQIAARTTDPTTKTEFLVNLARSWRISLPVNPFSILKPSFPHEILHEELPAAPEVL